MPGRAAFYIDGFNLYHAIDDLRQPHLKWLDLWALGAHVIPRQSQALVRVVWCAALKTSDTQKMLRHRQLIYAQEARGVVCLKGHFATEPRECRNCRDTWDAPIEKQGDVNLALSLLDDAYRDVFDYAYLVSADGDQAATIRMVKERFPEKRVVAVAPPKRQHNKITRDLADDNMVLKTEQLERCLLPRAVMSDDNTRVLAQRPNDYAPPAGWRPPI